ncbi:hypothetical protein MPTK1_8g14480 [Marchantia polymorpha subsp. ruderalis]|nr:hypothetical protein Mp_8g14480 [Marchantia polymorpha subsp. ruderalis]
MDSAHEEPELPSAIQDLLQRLEGQGEPLTMLPNLSWNAPEFFPERASLSTITGWRSQVRHRVLEAIGNCNTFEILYFNNICGGDVSRLTASEWEIVFRGFRSSTVLQRIYLYDLKWSSDAEVETLCLELGRILNSSSVTQLVVQRCRLSARCWSNLASGLRGHSDSKLQSLELLGDAWEDESAVKHVAEMINSAPLLETLDLKYFSKYMNMEDETVGILSQALIQSSSLRDLGLGGAGKWGGPLLLKALAGDDRNRSIERLRLFERMDGLGDCLREILISNPSLKEVKLYKVKMSPEEWHQLGEVIRDNAIATTILVYFYLDRNEWKSIEALALSASSDVKDPILELELEIGIRAKREDKVKLSLNLLGRVLRGEIKSLKSLIIRQSDKPIITFSILPMNGKIGETSVQKRLELSFRSEDISKGEWEELLRCMRGNHLTHLDLCHSRLDQEAFRDVMGVLQVNLALIKDPTLELDLQARSEDEVMLSLNLLGRVLRGEIQSLKSLSIWQSEKPIITFSILPMNGKTGETSVQKRLELSVRSENLSKGEWEELLRCMRGNHLTHLDLSDSELDEEAFRDVMGVLQVNLALQEIDVSRTSWATDGKAALIQESLQQNKERAVYMSVFREANLTFGDAKAGRLFLCGSPRAGKTQLRKTLMRINHSWLHKSNLFNRWEVLWRTKGIEVEFLRKNDEMQISVWDLAGQWIFRTLQTVLFPQTNNFCVFLFVYSPFCEEKSSKKPDSCFETELEDWLSFFTSSIRVTGRDLPQVFVVISHKDKAIYSSVSWAQSIVEKLTQRFANYVDLRPIQECFHVDARKKKQVSSLNRHIFENFHKLLSDKSPQVPKLCLQLTSLLVTNTKKNKSFPLWPSKKFYDFCVSDLKKFIPSSSAHSVEHSRIMQSIISYLNDVGSIIYIPNLDYIIVDPNWLTNTFLGELIALGQNFQAQEPESSYRMSSYASKDGFVSESVFVRLIEEFLGNQSHGQRGVDREKLENILVNLDLCFKLKDTSQYFIPSFIPEHASKEEQKHEEGAHVDSMFWDNRSETSQFVGIRIQCQDEITMSLTAAFFPRFQMFIRRKLISEEMSVFEENVICSRHYLRLFLDGHQIYIEHIQSEKSHKYVDVLMLCSSQKSKEAAITYVRKHIVQELISFCASPKGCLGVALVLGVIQTFCVEMLIPSRLRKVILIETLKSDFIRSINGKLEEMPLEKSHLMEKEELFHYEHCWPPIGRYTGQISELARDLLWESDVEAVVNEIHQNRIQQLESLEEGIISVDNGLALCYPEAENMNSGSDAPQIKDLKPLSSRCLSRSSTSVENRSTRLVLFKIEQLKGEVQGLHKKVDDLDERLREVHSIMQRVDMKMEHILSVHQELQSKLSVFMSKVDRSIGYSQEIQQRKTPKRPYVTDDVGHFYRLSAGLHVGKIVRLHLMCESMTGFHTVKDQEGLKLRLDLEKWEWIRRTIEISYKVIYYGAKAALTKFCGLGEAIPAWADLEADIVKLDGISSEDRKAVLTGGESKELQEAWLRIQQILAPELEYSKIFKLYQVKYVSLKKGGHAWVCEECMNKGLRCGILTR